MKINWKKLWKKVGALSTATFVGYEMGDAVASINQDNQMPRIKYIEVPKKAKHDDQDDDDDFDVEISDIKLVLLKS